MTRHKATIAGVLMVLSTATACGGEDSHNAGRDCLQCHRSGGSGDGIFSVAGTVYGADRVTSQSGVTVAIYSAPEANAADLVATLTTDGSGNFYTTQALDFDGQTRYPVLVSGAEREEKPFAAQSGACNSCHRGEGQADPLTID